MMTRAAIILAALVAASSAFAAPWPVCPENAPARDGENCVVDGDTIRMGRARLRIAGLDTPERGEPGHKAATDALARMLGAGPVAVDEIGRDRFGRLLVTLTVDGHDVAAAMIAGGYGKEWK